MPENVFAFIDESNVKYSAQAMGFINFDYEKFKAWAESKGISRIYIYGSYLREDSEQLAFYEELERLGYLVSKKEVMTYRKPSTPLDLKCPSCSHKFKKYRKEFKKTKANCDVELTLDVMNQCSRHRCSKVYIFTADGDFSKLFEYIATELRPRIKVVVYSPLGKYTKRTSLKLKELNRSGTIKIEDLASLFNSCGAKR